MKCIVSLGEGLVLETVTYFRCPNLLVFVLRVGQHKFQLQCLRYKQIMCLRLAIFSCLFRQNTVPIASESPSSTEICVLTIVSRGNEEFSSWTSSSWLELVDMARARENRDTRRYAVDRDKTSEGCAACASYGKSIMYNQ